MGGWVGGWVGVCASIHSRIHAATPLGTLVNTYQVNCISFFMTADKLYIPQTTVSLVTYPVCVDY